MSFKRTLVNVITGATGAGKTRLISEFLEMRPREERWAVLVNDFGHSAVAAEQSGVSCREIAACVCCTGQVELRTAIVSLIRELRPHRLFVESSAAAHPAAIANVLREPGIAPHVELRTIICAVDPRQAIETRYIDTQIYREQMRSADTVVISRRSAVPDADARAARLALERITSVAIVALSERAIDERLLDLALQR